MELPYITVSNQPPSAQIRADLAGQKVLLAFSRGKDSVAAWLALREAGAVVVPYHMYLVPRLGFVAEDLARWEGFFGQHIVDIPHPSLFRWLNNFTFQAPERLATIEAAQLPDLEYEQVVELLRDRLGCPGAWVADGVRAADSPQRRVAIATRGAWREKHRKVSVVWDWRKAHVMDAISAAGAQLGPEYGWFGRSFDGIDARFLGPLREHRPDDYQRVLDWFPMAEMDLLRAGWAGAGRG